MRRGFHVFLASSAIAATLAACVSFFVPVTHGFALDARNWTCLHVYHGRFRVFWIHAPLATLEVEQRLLRPQLDIRAQYPPVDEWLPAVVAAPLRQSTLWRARISIGSRRQVGPFGGALKQPLFPPPYGEALPRVTYFRIPLVLPVALLLIPPVRACLRARRVRRRQRRNLCVNCGYDLRGLRHARCPECGTVTTASGVG